MYLRHIVIAMLFFILTFSHTQILAEIQAIARIGEPTIGFPEGMVYSDVTNPIIGAAGHIAFTGSASNGVSRRGGISAVWGGLPGQLSVLMKENDVLVGFPANIYLGPVFSKTQPVVTASGAVGIIVRLEGDSDDATGVLAHIAGTTYGIIKTGDQAIGFPAGSLVKEILDFAFTDAGMIITAEVTGVTSRRRGIWLWNRNGLEMIPSPITGCHYGYPISYVSINETGETAFTASLVKDDDSFCSPSAGVFKTNDGGAQILVKQNDPVPGMPDARFFDVNLDLTSLSPMINDDGSVVFSAELMEGSRQKISLWVTDGLNEPKLLFLTEETLKSDLDEMRIDSSSQGNFSLNNFVEGNSTILPIGRGVNGNSLMIGEPRDSQPYNNLDLTGTTQLTEIVATGDQPVGVDSNWVINGFKGTFGKPGEFVLTASVKHSINGSVLNGFWRSDEDRRLRLVAMEAMKIPVNGEERLLRSTSLAHTISAPRYRSSWVSRRGEIVFYGSLEDGGSGIFLIADDSQEQKIFTLAEQLFPQYFSPANVDDRLLEGFVYRYYPATNTYIGIKNGEVFVLGDAFGIGPQRIDTIENTLRFLEERVTTGS